MLWRGKKSLAIDSLQGMLVISFALDNFDDIVSSASFLDAILSKNLGERIDISSLSTCKHSQYTLIIID